MIFNIVTHTKIIQLKKIKEKSSNYLILADEHSMLVLIKV